MLLWVYARPPFCMYFTDFYGCTPRTGASAFLVPCPTLGSVVPESLGISILVLWSIKRKEFKIMIYGERSVNKDSLQLGHFYATLTAIFYPSVLNPHQLNTLVKISICNSFH